MIILLVTAVYSQAPRQQQYLKQYYQYKQRHFPEVPDITVRQLTSLSEFKNAILVDVRTPEERAVSLIPEAISEDSLQLLPESALSGTPIIVYCTIGIRSGYATREMRKKGLKAFNLVGGILSWAAEGRLFQMGPIRGKRVHIYSREWNFLVPGYEAVY